MTDEALVFVITDKYSNPSPFRPRAVMAPSVLVPLRLRSILDVGRQVAGTADDAQLHCSKHLRGPLLAGLAS